MKVLVLGGGSSPEREVSLRSAKAVAAAARQAGFEVIEADPREGLDVLDTLSKKDVVLPILHGAEGEDGVLQKQLEKKGLAYLGSNSTASEHCFDKWHTRQVLMANGIKMPEGEMVDKASYYKSPLAQQPHVLKVIHGGSSIGTAIIENLPADLAKSRQIFELESKAVIEQLIVGKETTVPVLDGKALPVIEIVPPPDGEFDYDNKYNGRTQELCPPVSIDEATQIKARAIAEKVHALMNCRHLSRVDIMVDQFNKLYVLEINTIPGLTDQSLYPKSAAVAGLTMPELVGVFIELVERDFKLK